MKNKILSIVICLVLCFILSLPSFAVSVYGSVNASTSQVQILYSYLRNESEFDPLQTFYIIRTGEYEYSAYYNVNGSSCPYITYKRQPANNVWVIETHYTDNFYLSFSDSYTVVGNVPGTLSIEDNNEYIYQYIVIIAVFFIMFTIMFFVFRVHKRGFGI